MHSLLRWAVQAQQFLIRTLGRTPLGKLEPVCGLTGVLRLPPGCDARGMGTCSTPQVFGG